MRSDVAVLSSTLLIALPFLTRFMIVTVREGSATWRQAIESRQHERESQEQTRRAELECAAQVDCARMEAITKIECAKLDAAAKVDCTKLQQPASKHRRLANDVAREIHRTLDGAQ
jgi:hypothetical protein